MAFGVAIGGEALDSRWVTAAVIDQLAAAAAGIGAAWVRFEVAQTTDFTQADRLVYAFAAAGVTPRIVLGRRASNLQPLTPDPVSFPAFAGTLAARYRGVVGSYEVGNEVNSAFFWGTTPNPTLYGTVLARSYDAITTADPAADVGFAGMMQCPTSGSASMSPPEFVSRALLTCRGKFDFLNAHIYFQDWNTGAPTPPATDHYALTYARQLANLDTGVPLRITETGYSTSTSGGTSEANQAAWLRDSWPLLTALSDDITVYNLWDGSPADTQLYKYGLYRFDFTPRESARVARDIAAPNLAGLSATEIADVATNFRQLLSGTSGVVS